MDNVEKIEEQMQEIEKQNAMIAQMLYDEEENG